MKKKYLKTLLVLACVSVATYLSMTSPSTPVINNLLFDNVEALASGEGNGDYFCIGVGSIDCAGFKHDKKYTYLSLRPQ